MSRLKHYINNLYRQSGQLNLYLHYNSAKQRFDTERVAIEIENIKRVIAEIEKELDLLNVREYK